MLTLNKVVLRIKRNNKLMFDMEIECKKHSNLAIKSMVGKIVTLLADESGMDVPDLDIIKEDLYGHIGLLLVRDEKYLTLSSPAVPHLTVHPESKHLFFIKDKEYHVETTRLYSNAATWSVL